MSLELDRLNDRSKYVNDTLGLAHGLKLRAVAGGVERGQQAKVLRRLGCDDMS